MEHIQAFLSSEKYIMEMQRFLEDNILKWVRDKILKWVLDTFLESIFDWFICSLGGFLQKWRGGLKNLDCC